MNILKDDGHYFTSYPSLNHWTEDFQHPQYVEALSSFTGPLHLYLHIPFCKKLCSYCICNIIISNDRQKIQFFVDKLLKEIDLLKEFHPDIRDIHFGGGTPSHLDQKQFSQLCEKLEELVNLHSLSEVAMEIDPRTVNREDLKHYASHGVNRISFGVQDFDLKVQEAINRVQPPEMIEELLEERQLFSVNFDLLYGLPFQTHQTIEDTVNRTLKMRPERITVLKYCHAPEVRRHMKLINVTDLPSPDELPLMFRNIAETLTGSGYEWIGLDHFCLPTDSLAKRHVRTFNGFSAGSREMIGLGPTSTGVFGEVYCQAHYDLKEYYAAIDRGEFPILRGYRMTPEDLRRREVIFSLLSHQRVVLEGFEREREILSHYPSICRFEGDTLIVTDRYRVRNVCKAFDVKDVKPEHLKIAQKSMTLRAA